MKHFGKIVSYLILAINAFFIGMLILTAYSSYLHPKIHPLASCLGLAFPIFLAVNICFFIFWLIINYRYTILTIIGFLICYPQIKSYIPINFPDKSIPEESIKLLSYNVMGFNNMEKKDGQNPILTYLSNSGADIICLQEYNASGNKKYVTEKDIKKALKAYPYYSIRRPGIGDSQLACFSKFPILTASSIKYESSYNGSMLYTLKVNEDTITLINNHLESNKLTKEDRGIYEDMINDPNAKKVKTGLRQLVKKLAEASAIRSVQADSVANVIMESKYPTIITCGDFNDVSISYTHRILTQHLDDAFTQSGKGLGISYNQNKFYFRIDNILISPNLKAYNCTVDRSIKDSDHYPIWCHISKR
ncbi:endonuclease/exonuclease/phosphatase family protein [Bacteroides sp.]|uniref:endonuclease/exonuclease/phosphatase family protein n=1 Tax=Bacteroides sp. TaxID=29523 RepID=UPI0026380877|nr:endonuclease/exonuclease/phosphatase family protein [Bacteroides sp.]MDD3036906.1 endonuclease/exonuclease/phosphatase family protein [Bacteroides sp.]